MTKPIHYQRHIDGLRALAVLTVVFYHYGQTMFGGGFIGVDVFFVISGYLISKLIFTEITNTNDFNFKRFYIRRARRLLPALIATLAASLFFAAALFSPEQFQDFGRSLFAAVFSVSNILFWQESGYFSPDAHLRPLLHTWSLGVEEQFYLIWPALLWFIARKFESRQRLTLLMVVVFISFALNYIWVHGNFDVHFSSTIFYLTPFRMFELAIGGLAIFSTRIIPSSPWFHEVAMTTGLALILYSATNYTDEIVFPYFGALVPCAGAFLVIASNKAYFTGRLLSNRLAVGIGLVSYSLYLIHWPVLVFYKHFDYGVLGQLEYLGLFVLSSALSVMMYFWVEKPFRKYSPAGASKEGQTRFLISSGAALTLIAIIGLAIAQSDGRTWLNGKALSIEKISAGTQQRYDLIRAGCNLSRLDKAKFCKRKRPYQILVIGNSHEPDGFNIFSQVYRSNKQVNLISFGTLNTCQISFSPEAPKSDTKQRSCDTRIAMLANSDFISTLDGIVFSSNMPFDQKQASAWKILEYIKKSNPRIAVAVLGGYLNTNRKCSNLFYHYGSLSACRDDRHVSYNPFDERKELDREAHGTLDYLYIDKTRLLCKNGTLSSCEVSAGNEPAFYDWHHLSMGFSKHLGDRIAQVYEPELKAHGFPAIISAPREE